MGKRSTDDLVIAPHVIQHGALVGLRSIDTSDPEAAYLHLWQITEVLLELLDPKISKEVKRIREEVEDRGRQHGRLSTRWAEIRERLMTYPSPDA